MHTVLKDEEKDDLKTKEACEKDRADDTREAIVAARKIDEMTESIVRWRSQIAELKAEEDQHSKEISEIEDDLKKAKEIREAENEEFLAVTADDKKAKELVLEA